jgi:hypothetical protein
VTRFRTRGGLAAWSSGVLAVAGFYAIVLGWRGAAATSTASLQLPYLVSGGFGGLALIVFAAVLLHLDVSRRLAAEEDATMRDLVDATSRLVVALAPGDESPA